MALEALSSTELLNFIMYESNLTSPITTPFPNGPPAPPPPPPPPETATTTQGRKKRRRKPTACKNKKEAETQRMTHIAVERNRRKQMNEHLGVLRSLMPESYVQRGDQASIVGGAIEFVKELEHILQSLEAKKYTLFVQGNGLQEDNKGHVLHGLVNSPPQNTDDDTNQFLGNPTSTTTSTTTTTPFAQFFAYPQFSCSHNQLGSKYSSQSKAAIADIEVTLIETHANVRILSRRRVRQLSKIVASFHSVFLSILHLNVTTLDSFVLYSISAKVEEGCQLNSADDIAGAVHHMLRIIEEEAILGCET